MQANWEILEVMVLPGDKDQLDLLADLDLKVQLASTDLQVQMVQLEHQDLQAEWDLLAILDQLVTRVL